MASKGDPKKPARRRPGQARARTAPWAQVQSGLRPVIRPLARTSHEANLRGVAISRSFGPFLAIFVVVDTGEAMRFVTARHLAEWAMTEDQVFANALANLTAHADADVAPLDDDAPRLWRAGNDDYHASSRLLIPGFLAGFRDRVPGQPIAIIPEPGTLLIAGDRDPADVLRLAELARDTYDEAEASISPALYTVDAKGAVVPYLAPGPGPIATAVKLAETMMALGEYAQQKHDLEALLAQAGEDVAVASYTAIRKPGGRPVSWSLWADGQPTLLPRTDAVHIAGKGDDRDGFDVPWEAIEKAAPGILAEVAGMVPPRWRTRRWPKPVELNALRAAACDLDVLGRATVTAEVDAAIAGFWTWWKQARPKLERAIAAGDQAAAAGDQAAVTDAIAERVHAIDDELHWELTPGQSARHALTVSANGDADRRAITERWRALAPPADATWEFHASRQQRPGATLTWNGRRMALADAVFVWAADDDADRLDIAIHHPAFVDMDGDDRESAAVLLLDAALGEDGVEQWIGGIDVAHKRPRNAQPLAAFLAAIEEL